MFSLNSIQDIAGGMHFYISKSENVSVPKTKYILLALNIYEESVILHMIDPFFRLDHLVLKLRISVGMEI